MVTKKGRENERKAKNGKTGTLTLFTAKNPSPSTVYQNGLCSLTNQVKYHPIQTLVITTRVERIKNKNCSKKLRCVKCRRTGGCRNSARAGGISQVLQFPYSFTFLAFSAFLSFWYLIWNVEFDLNSSCSDRLNNFGTISSQKLQNLPQSVIIKILGTVMRKSG